MFTESLQKISFPVLLVIAALLFFGIFAYAAVVYKNDPPPADAKEIFKDSLGKPLSDTAAGTADLSIQHMSSEEVARWVDVIMAESLSFTPSNFDENTRLVKNYFTDSGYAQYQAYLAQTKFADIIKSQRLTSGAYAERPPLEANSMVQNGVYKWLYDVPVTLSFLPVTSQNYNGGGAKPQNQRFTLRLQLTRVADPENPNRIKVELWQILPFRG